CPLVLPRCSLCLEGAEISSFTPLRIFLAGIQPILAGFQLPDHKNFSAVHVSPLQSLPSRVCSSDAPPPINIRIPTASRAPLDTEFPATADKTPAQRS